MCTVTRRYQRSINKKKIVDGYDQHTHLVFLSVSLQCNKESIILTFNLADYRNAILKNYILQYKVSPTEEMSQLQRTNICIGKDIFEALAYRKRRYFRDAKIC